MPGLPLPMMVSLIFGLVRAWQTVTEAMLASGFNTRSNLNLEFLRVMGAAPTGWLMRQDVVDKAADAAA